MQDGSNVLKTNSLFRLHRDDNGSGGFLMDNTGV